MITEVPGDPELPEVPEVPEVRDNLDVPADPEVLEVETYYHGLLLMSSFFLIGVALGLLLYSAAA